MPSYNTILPFENISRTYLLKQPSWTENEHTMLRASSSSFSPSTVKRKLLHSHHYSGHFLTMLTTFILVSLNIPIHHAFLTKPLSSFHHTHHHQHSAATKITTTETSITVPSSVLDKQANINTSNNNKNDNYNTITNNNNNLNGGNSESSVINVVRKCSPSVSSVTSYAVIPPPPPPSSSSSSSPPPSVFQIESSEYSSTFKAKIRDVDELIIWFLLFVLCLLLIFVIWWFDLSVIKIEPHRDNSNGDDGWNPEVGRSKVDINAQLYTFSIIALSRRSD